MVLVVERLRRRRDVGRRPLLKQTEGRTRWKCGESSTFVVSSIASVADPFRAVKAGFSGVMGPLGRLLLSLLLLSWEGKLFQVNFCTFVTGRNRCPVYVVGVAAVCAANPVYLAINAQRGAQLAPRGAPRVYFQAGVKLP